MEDQEDIIDNESDRSSVISELDELEANLYSYIHHERNESYENEHSNEYSVRSLEGEVQDFFRCSVDEILSYGDVESKSSGKETCSDKIEDDDTNVCKINRECNDSSKAKPNKLSDSKYDVGDKKHASFETESSDTVVHVPEPISVPKDKKDSGGYSSVEILSSSDDDATKPMSKNTSSKSKSKVLEVVTLEDNSDSDIVIEFEKVSVKNKKKKKKKGKEIAMDIKLNTVRAKKKVFKDGTESPNINSVEKTQPVTILSFEENSLQYRAPSCKNWTQAMVQFYNESWGGECVNLGEIQESMSDKGWEVDISDEYDSVFENIRNRRYFGNKSKGWCTNCQRKGHYRNECSEEVRPPSCFRCGSARHIESKCNKTLCLTCGKETDYLVTACQSCRNRKRIGKRCSICQQFGHNINCCPDIWRRYYATVVPGKIVRPKTRVYKESKNVFCCNCATRGHLAYQCNKNTFSDYIPISPKVVSYKNPAVEYAKFNTTASENWDKVGRTAPVTEVTHQKKKEKRGKKRPRISEFCGTSKLLKLSESARRYADKMQTNRDSRISNAKSAKKSKNIEKSNLESSGNLIQDKVNKDKLLIIEESSVKYKVNLCGKQIQTDEGNSASEQQISLEKNTLGSTTDDAQINIVENSGIQSLENSDLQPSSNLIQMKLDKRNSNNGKQSLEKKKFDLYRNLIPINLEKRNSLANNRKNQERNQIQTSTPKTSKENGKNTKLPKRASVESLKAQEVRVNLTDDEFNKVTGVYGDEILKQLTKKVKGLAASPIDEPNRKSMLLIGTKKTTYRGKLLLKKLIRSADTCTTSDRPNNVQADRVEPDSTGNGFYQQILGETTCYETPLNIDFTQDIRIEVNNISNSRNVSYFQEPEENNPNLTAVQEQCHPSYSYDDLIPGYNKDFHRARNHIQNTAKVLLTNQDFSYERLKPFAEWCITEYGCNLKKIVKTHLKFLMLDKYKNKPSGFFKRHLTVIATWQPPPMKLREK